MLPRIISYLHKYPTASASLLILAIFTMAALLAPVIAPSKLLSPNISHLSGSLLPDPTAIDPAHQHLKPGTVGHLLGTDELGRDVLSRLIYGARVSLYVGFLATVISTAIGTLVGALAGYYGGWVDNVIMRFVDFMFSLPMWPLVLAISAITTSSKSGEWTHINMLVGFMVFFGWMLPARLARAAILSLRQQLFIEAARALGAGEFRIIVRHLIPNASGPLIANMTLEAGYFILAEAGLSFLGFGISPPTPSWGNMLVHIQDYLFVNPILAIWPGLCILFCVISINFIGDSIRVQLDAKTQRINSRIQ